MNYITTYLRKIISRGYYSTIRLCGWIVLFCAVILGRYYTDNHNVDEDLIAILIHGGRYNHELQAGITRRNLQDWVGMTGNDVASSNTQKYRVIRMNTMSTKTMPLARSMVDVGIMRAGRVSHDEICTILPPLRSILLLRRS